MTRRFTETGKWKDRWFRGLSPTAKLLWFYVCENCDIAGFWEVDLPAAAWFTGSKLSTLTGALKELDRGLFWDDDYVWLRNFIYYQNNLPLNPKNNCHAGILNRIHEHKSISDKV